MSRKYTFVPFNTTSVAPPYTANIRDGFCFTTFAPESTTPTIDVSQIKFPSVFEGKSKFPPSLSDTTKQEDIKKLFASYKVRQEGNNVTFKTKDDNVYYCKRTLARKSEYFNKLFTFNSQTGQHDDMFVTSETQTYSSDDVILLLAIFDNEITITPTIIFEKFDWFINVITMMNFYLCEEVLVRLLIMLHGTSLDFKQINKLYDSAFMDGPYNKYFSETIDVCVENECKKINTMTGDLARARYAMDQFNEPDKMNHTLMAKIIMKKILCTQ